MNLDNLLSYLYIICSYFFHNSFPSHWLILHKDNFYELYNKKSLPIVVINDEHYDTMRMIMLILKIMDKDKLEKYLKDVLLECDLMSSYRIKTLMSQVCEDPVY